jgi:hypothetical protein
VNSLLNPDIPESKLRHSHWLKILANFLPTKGMIFDASLRKPDLSVLASIGFSRKLKAYM